jgi:RND superfamily putative drug exporter
LINFYNVVFIFVFACRKNGYSNRAAVVVAVGRTGGVISAAGIIMAISFGGLMLSNIVVLNQFGFLLSCAVMFDTFVIRTCLVPAVLFIAGDWVCSYFIYIHVLSFLLSCDVLCCSIKHQPISIF